MAEGEQGAGAAGRRIDGERAQKSGSPDPFAPVPAGEQPRHPDLVAELAAEASGLLTELRHGPLDVPIPTCPGWDLAALACHLGGVHRWVTRILIERCQDAPPAVDEPSLTGSAAVQFFEDGLVGLLDALGTTPPDAPVWFFSRTRPAAWWRRRQAIETLIHRVDAELARGEVGPVDPLLAAEGLSEYAEFIVRGRARRVGWPAGRLVVHGTDTGGEWLLAAPDVDETAPTVEVRGRAEDLLLVLWQRRSPDVVDWTGDADARLAWLTLGSP